MNARAYVNRGADAHLRGKGDVVLEVYPSDDSRMGLALSIQDAHRLAHELLVAACDVERPGPTKPWEPNVSALKAIVQGRFYSNPFLRLEANAINGDRRRRRPWPRELPSRTWCHELWRVGSEVLCAVRRGVPAGETVLWPQMREGTFRLETHEESGGFDPATLRPKDWL